MSGSTRRGGRQHNRETGTGLQPVHDYHFEFQKFHITNTRAAHNDTDTVSLALKDDGAQPARVLIKHLGEVNNGDHPVQPKIGPIVFQGTEQVRLVTTVLQSVTPSGPTPGTGPRFMPSRSRDPFRYKAGSVPQRSGKSEGRGSGTTWRATTRRSLCRQRSR
jgi:hypothetical protein